MRRWSASRLRFKRSLAWEKTCTHEPCGVILNDRCLQRGNIYTYIYPLRPLLLADSLQQLLGGLPVSLHPLPLKQGVVSLALVTPCGPAPRCKSAYPVPHPPPLLLPYAQSHKHAGTTKLIGVTSQQRRLQLQPMSNQEQKQQEQQQQREQQLPEGCPRAFVCAD